MAEAPSSRICGDRLRTGCTRVWTSPKTWGKNMKMRLPDWAGPRWSAPNAVAWAHLRAAG